VGGTGFPSEQGQDGGINTEEKMGGKARSENPIGDPLI